ncbi:GAF and ANTAR domain-containing protein [Knoellia sp. Soil729]|uniref:GAF and ANTAR domain-containing protein n=1 Tax=Knoellia sp. Soil729 TaxID=1736394 RepID=UPI0006F5BC81|nr:GAF and ANTAR domain-containing protein [Knoellia sp. Soil729]KRE40823.1 hypothetical protein ASG74_15205 [Knoellia sp. Soil729]
MEDRATLLSSLARAMAQQDPSTTLAARLCSSAVTLLGGEGASITLTYSGHERVTLCSSGDTAARLADLQDVFGQGPSWQAFDSGEQQLWMSHDASAEQPWPALAHEVRSGLGSVSVCALPIRPDHEVLGVLTCHFPTGSAPLLDHAHAQFLADAIGVALLRDPETTASDASGPWTAQAQIHQATGMVVAQLHIGLEDALALLRAHAFAADQSLAATAESVVGRGLDFTDPDSTGTTDPNGTS